MLTIIPFQNGADLGCKFVFMDSVTNFVKKWISQNSALFQTKYYTNKKKENMTENVPALHN